jgi:putative transport protein
MDSLMIIFLIAVLGYGLGSITIKGLSLGTSGVLIVALIFGHFNFEVPIIIRNVGLVSFVTTVGFIAGPRFIDNFKKKAKAFIILGVVIILVGALICLGVILIGGIPCDLAVGMMSGALTSTPGLAAAIEATRSDMASIGYGIAYPFGVVGVVLFVQLIPSFLKIDIPAERARMETISAFGDKNSIQKKREKKSIQLDDFGIIPFSLAVVMGLLIAKITIPLPGGASFSLGTSGGPLLAGLLLAHVGYVGPVSVSMPKSTLEVIREVGLALFLMGAGTNAGKGFVEIIKQYGVALFLLSALMTIAPMLAGYIIARKIFKIDVLNTLGAICGGMTSTPSLGTLMAMTKTEAVAISYAATYPVALIFVVLCCQFIPILLL